LFGSYLPLFIYNPSFVLRFLVFFTHFTPASPPAMLAQRAGLLIPPWRDDSAGLPAVGRLLGYFGPVPLRGAVTVPFSTVPLRFAEPKPKLAQV